MSGKDATAMAATVARPGRCVSGCVSMSSKCHWVVNTVRRQNRPAVRREGSRLYPGISQIYLQ